MGSSGIVPGEGPDEGGKVLRIGLDAAAQLADTSDHRRFASGGSGLDPTLARIGCRRAARGGGRHGLRRGADIGLIDDGVEGTDADQNPEGDPADQEGDVVSFHPLLRWEIHASRARWGRQPAC